MRLLYLNDPETHLCALAVYQSSATSFCTRFTLYKTNRDTFNGCRSESTCPDQAAYKQGEIDAGNLEFLNTYSVAGNGWAILTLPENTVLKYGASIARNSARQRRAAQVPKSEIQATESWYRRRRRHRCRPAAGAATAPPSPPPSLSPSPPAPNRRRRP